MEDALEFLNDRTEPQTPTPPPAPAMAPAPAAESPKPVGPQPTSEDHNKALAVALDREMSRRRWARAAAIEIALAGQRDQLGWLEAQSLTRRAAAIATGEMARQRAAITRLEAAHKQALAREAGLAKALQADPIAAALMAEEAEAGARQRADLKADATRILADREAQAEARREQALQRERQAQAHREAEQDKDETRPRKKSGGAAPKPR